MKVTELMKPGITDTSRSPHLRMCSISPGSVLISSGFWHDRIAAGRNRGLLRLYDLLEEHGVVDNFRRLSGKPIVERKGPIFTDSDLYKWMEAAALTLWSRHDPGLESLLDGVIEDVAGAQDPDGYLNTYFVQEREGDRFSNLEHDHELYCAGHLIQAAVAHFRATGKRNLLDCAVRFADHLVSTFGPDGRSCFCGHPELEMAMVELYRTVGKVDYLHFAAYLLDQIKFSSRTSMEGHAVRAGYACCGGADLVLETGAGETREALRRLWEDMEGFKVYVTGGIGSRYVHEAFGEPYELPNLRAYAETCAAISNGMWSWRMLSATGECRYADMLETVLYNGFLSGVSLSGDKYFYMNPLESSGSQVEGERGHRRAEWYSCTCCPTNVQRTLASLPGYIYGMDSNSVWVNLFQSSRLSGSIGSTGMTMEQVTRYPWGGDVDIALDHDSGIELGVRLRIPSWVSGCKVHLNGDELGGVRPGRYLSIDDNGDGHSRISASFEMPVRLLGSHPRVREDFGCAAIARGPVIYCVESVDNPGVDVQNLMLPPDPEFEFEFDPDLLGGVGVIRFDALEVTGSGPLYQNLNERELDLDPCRVTAIPYYAWANRGGSSMLVWFPIAPGGSGL